MKGSGAGERESNEGGIFSASEAARTEYWGKEGKSGREVSGQVQGQGKTIPLIGIVWDYGDA